MPCREQRRRETETCRERVIRLKLSDADVRRISEQAASVGLTVPQLLENFIGDLVGGTYSNGSDERLLANQWLERCGFAMYAEKSLLRYTLLYRELDTLLRIWDEREKLRDEITGLAINSAGANQEEIIALKEELEFCDESLQELFIAYRQYSPQCDNIEKEMKAVLQWRDEYRKLLGENSSSA